MNYLMKPLRLTRRAVGEPPPGEKFPGNRRAATVILVLPGASRRAPPLPDVSQRCPTLPAFPTLSSALPAAGAPPNTSGSRGPRSPQATFGGHKPFSSGRIPGVPSLVSEPATATILIVDDDEGVTQTFARMLRLEGYAVRTAVTAENGLREAATTHPDAIILDLRMPLVDGLGFLRRLRETETSRTPVAIVTGDYFLEDDISAELQALGAELRFKPLWLEDLVGLARNLLKVTH